MTTIDLLSENFDGSGAGIDHPAGWDIVGGEIRTTNCNEGRLTFDTVDATGLENAKLTFDARTELLWHDTFEGSGHYKDSLEVLLLDANGHVIAVLDTFVGDGHQMTSATSGNSITSGGVSLEYDLPAGLTEFKIAFNSSISSHTELVYLDNVHLSADAGPDGVVDGEETGEVMGLGYDDANAPTDGGGDLITDGDDSILGNGGDDDIDGAGGNDEINGGTGNDTINGNDGEDLILGDGLVVTSDHIEAVIVNEDFTGGASGWSNNHTRTDNAGNHYLGGFGHTWSRVDTEKTFIKPSYIPYDTKSLTIEFDFYEIDSWDGESFKVFINDHKVDLGRFYNDVYYRHLADEDREGTTGNISWEVQSVQKGHLAGNAHFQDEYHRVTLTVTDPSDHLKIGFGSHLNEWAHNESWGIDNLKVTATSTEFVTVSDTGDDTIDGGADDDVIYGDNAEDVSGVVGGTFTGPRESFNWEGKNDHEADNGFTQNTGSVTVTYDRTADVGHHDSTVDDHTHLNTDGIDGGTETVDTNSSLKSVNFSSTDNSAFQWDFSEPVGNLEFNINDLDGDGVVTVRAFDADGNEIDVTLDGGSDIAVSGDTASATGPYRGVTSDENLVQVTVDGPVSRLVVEHFMSGGDDSGIHITDLFFDTGFQPVDIPGVNGEGGDDVITGGAGSDSMFGEGGDDTFLVTTASDAAGDVVVGGNGPDQTTDNDVLDLTGAGAVIIDEEVDDTDEGATTGTVTFEDGSVLTFSQIEEIITDPLNAAPDAIDDAAILDPGTDLLLDLLGNDSDPDSDPLTIIAASDGIVVGGGDTTLTTDGGRPVVVTVAPSGAVTALLVSVADDYLPLGEGDTDAVSFTYTISDGNGLTDTATVSIDIEGENDDPVITTPSAITALDDDPDIGDTVAIIQASDVDLGDVLTFSITPDATDDSAGFAIDPVTGEITVAPGFTLPDADADLLWEFEVVVTDSFGATDTLDVELSFGPGTPPPADPGCGGLGDPSSSPVTPGVSFDGTNDSETIQGTDIGDTISGNGGDDTIFGNGGDDTLLGNAGNDVLCGGLGNDQIHGGRDGDILLGGAGDDRVGGNRDDDQIQGGQGQDELEGEGGADLFVIDTLHILSGPLNDDTIIDFEAGIDTITFENLGTTAVSFATIGADTTVLLDGQLALTVQNATEAEVAAGIVDESTVSIFSF